jgi:hypothetical protein
LLPEQGAQAEAVVAVVVDDQDGKLFSHDGFLPAGDRFRCLFCRS